MKFPIPDAELQVVPRSGGQVSIPMEFTHTAGSTFEKTGH